MLPLQKQDPEDPLLHPRRAVAEIKLANDIDTSKVVDDHVLPSDKLLDDRGCQVTLSDLTWAHELPIIQSHQI